MPYTAEELAQHMENDCMLVGWDEVPAMLRSQATELARLRETLNFIATHFSSDWPERCQSNVLAARHALTQGPNVFSPDRASSAPPDHDLPPDQTR